jgi:hypothetical protein
MRTARWLVALPLCTLCALAASAGASRAGPIYGVTGTGGAGQFTAWVEYTSPGPGSATLTVELRNTSPPANGGFITAFALDTPPGGLTGVTLTSPDPDFNLIGGSAGGRIHAPPLGTFDLGASLSNSFLGGGAPQGGIGVGQSATFTFWLSGALDGLTTADFLAGDGFVARFRGFADGDSDKVRGVPTAGPSEDGPQHAPEPGTLALALMGITAAGLAYRRTRRSAA